MLEDVELHMNRTALAHWKSFTQVMQCSKFTSILEHYCLILADPMPVNFLLITLCMMEATSHLIEELPDLQVPL